MTDLHIDRLIQWLQNASVTHLHFTSEGPQEVCKPKYLLTRDRDYIISLLQHERVVLGESVAKEG
jgi:hypothetical protein